jgi:hypothetical protein
MSWLFGYSKAAQPTQLTQPVQRRSYDETTPSGMLYTQIKQIISMMNYNNLPKLAQEITMLSTLVRNNKEILASYEYASIKKSDVITNIIITFAYLANALKRNSSNKNRIISLVKPLYLICRSLNIEDDEINNFYIQITGENPPEYNIALNNQVPQGSPEASLSNLYERVKQIISRMHPNNLSKLVQEVNMLNAITNNNKEILGSYEYTSIKKSDVITNIIITFAYLANALKRNATNKNRIINIVKRLFLVCEALKIGDEEINKFYKQITGENPPEFNISFNIPGPNLPPEPVTAPAFQAPVPPLQTFQAPVQTQTSLINQAIANSSKIRVSPPNTIFGPLNNPVQPVSNVRVATPNTMFGPINQYINGPVKPALSRCGSSPIEINDMLDSIEDGAKAAGKTRQQYLQENLNVPESEAPTLYDALEALDENYQGGGRNRKSRKSRKNRKRKNKNKSRRN